jgi:hypothetical protein
MDAPARVHVTAAARCVISDGRLRNASVHAIVFIVGAARKRVGLPGNPRTGLTN